MRATTLSDAPVVGRQSWHGGKRRLLMHTTRRLVARGLWVLELLLALTLVALSVLNFSAYADPGEAGFNVVLAVMGVTYVTVGALIAGRRGNILGWIFCWIGIGFTLGGLGAQYALRATVTPPGSLPTP